MPKGKEVSGLQTANFNTKEKYFKDKNSTIVPEF
jgi:hypothetical protein